MSREPIIDPHDHMPPCGEWDCPYPDCLVDGFCVPSKEPLNTSGADQPGTADMVPSIMKTRTVKATESTP